MVVHDETKLTHPHFHVCVFLSFHTSRARPYQERSTQVPYQPLSHLWKSSGSQKEKKNQLWDRKKLSPKADVSLKISKSPFLSHSMWEQRSGKIRKNRHMGNTHTLRASITDSHCILVSKPKIPNREHIKIAHLGNSEKSQKRQNKESPLTSYRNGWVVVTIELGWEHSYPAPKWAKTPYSFFFSPVHALNNFDLPKCFGRFLFWIQFGISQGGIRNDNSYWDVVYIPFHQTEK